MRNPPWTRDELILVLDLYFRLGRRQADATDPEVVALSDTLRRLQLGTHRAAASRTGITLEATC